MTEQFKFRRANEITGTFVLLILALLVAAVLWMGRSQRWFRSNVTLRITLPESGAAGIHQGSEVYFLGTRVGSVSDVFVDTSGRMEARTKIRHDFFRFVRADSSALVKRKFGLAGDSFFEITRGVGQPLPEDNAVIVCNEQLPSALESAIEEVRGEVLAVLKKTTAGLETWTALGADLRKTGEHIDRVALRLDNIAARAQAGEGSVGKLIADPALANEAVMLLTNLNKTLGELRAVVTNLNAASVNVRAGTVRLPEITGAIADEAKDLPGFVAQAQSSMRELERLIQAMQRHWLLRKYVDHSNPPSSQSDDPPPAASRPRPPTSPKGSGFDER